MSSVYMAPLGTVYWAVLRLTRWTVESVLCPCKVLSLHGAPYRAANMDGHKHGALRVMSQSCRLSMLCLLCRLTLAWGPAAGLAGLQILYTAGTLSVADSGSGGSHHGQSC